MNIALCTDNNYIMPCGITMISVMENNKTIPITFHIIGMDLRERSKEILSSISHKYNGISILFHEVKKEFLESYDFSLHGVKHTSIAAYSRLFLADILPPYVEKILYLDCDIVVNKELSELWDTNIENYSIAGVPDLYCMFQTPIIEALGYSSTFKYINSGVLLINLKYWRDHNIIKAFISFYKEKHNKLSSLKEAFQDQDVINGTLYNTKLLLPLKYNVIDCYYVTKQMNLFQYQDEIYNAIREPVIIHYTSGNKPWLKTCWHSLRNEFIKYKKLSPWKDTSLSWNNISLSGKIQYYKRTVLYALNLKKPRYMKMRKDPVSGKFEIR
jgi:lipopolysaccharide biosynthesis glycosyltransferase